MKKWLLGVLLCALMAISCSGYPVLEGAFKCPNMFNPVARKVHIDAAFTPHERDLLYISFAAWYRVTTGIVDYRIIDTFSHPAMTEEPPSSSSDDVWIYRVESTDPLIATLPKTRIGFARRSWFVLIVDRLKSDEAFRAVTMHEMGHTLGMGHVDYQPAIMHATCNEACSDPQFTLADMAEYCRVMPPGTIVDNSEDEDTTSEL